MIYVAKHATQRIDVATHCSSPSRFLLLSHFNGIFPQHGKQSDNGSAKYLCIHVERISHHTIATADIDGFIKTINLNKENCEDLYYKQSRSYENIFRK